MSQPSPAQQIGRPEDFIGVQVLSPSAHRVELPRGHMVARPSARDPFEARSGDP